MYTSCSAATPPEGQPPSGGASRYRSAAKAPDHGRSPRPRGRTPMCSAGPAARPGRAPRAGVAALAPWMSDGELTDLACQLGRPTRGDEPVRVAVVASSQLELARLAGEAAALLPGLAAGRLTVRPGIFASDGARGRIVLLFPGEEALAPGGAE